MQNSEFLVDAKRKVLLFGTRNTDDRTNIQKRFGYTAHVVPR